MRHCELLFIEDNPHKRSKVIEYLQNFSSDIKITEAYSFSSGSQKFESYDFDFILTDISLPTFDKTISDSGGRFRAFGGLEIARKLSRGNSAAKIAFITQYRSFSEKGTSYTFNELEKTLATVSGSRYAGMIFYDSSESVWKEQLEAALGIFK